jgi:spermidine/putrescine transport system substrate-binding protein
MRGKTGTGLIHRFFAAAVLAGLGFAGAARAQEINALVWCDHTDPGFLEPFTKATGIKVNVKDYEGTGTALALLEQSKPGDWDVFVVDSTDVKRVQEKGILAPLDEKAFPLADIPDALKVPDFHVVNGKWYAVPEKFGYNAVAYDKSKVDPKAMRKVAAMWDPAYKGRVAIYDYYLPVMAQIAVGLGKSPRNLTEADIPEIAEKLKAMKSNAVVVGDVVTSQTALASGQADILIGGGEYAVSGLTKEKPNLDWVLPDEGGIRWQQAVGIFAESKNKEAAQKFIQYILSPEGQARLATSSCYWGMPVNTKATLSAEEKAILRWDEQPGFIAKSFPYPSPSDALDKAMQDAWASFLQSK